MSRIGKLPVKVPKGVNITLNEQTVKVKGPHGELSQLIPKEISVSISDDTVTVSKNEETIKARQNYGLIRSLVNNMVIGVSEKFEKKMQMIGVGYRAQVQGKKLTLLVGYSHPVEFEVPDGLEVKVEANTNLTVSGSDKEKVGLLASQIRATRPPEPYKGKGIRYVDEVVLRKAGKSGK
jgi:large subunit ribosomal protein L6|tara:strand:+ start:1588 stop:2124 length:537 start_codon:yes stop_codon:yes gene_type:complete